MIHDGSMPGSVPIHICSGAHFPERASPIPVQTVITCIGTCRQPMSALIWHCSVTLPCALCQLMAVAILSIVLCSFVRPMLWEQLCATASFVLHFLALCHPDIQFLPSFRLADMQHFLPHSGMQTCSTSGICALTQLFSAQVPHIGQQLLCLRLLGVAPFCKWVEQCIHPHPSHFLAHLSQPEPF